jgi:putative transposase
MTERALSGKMNHPLGYPSGAAKPANATDQRNGRGARMVPTKDGPIRIEVLRNRDGSFKPLPIPKHERRFTGFDDTIVAMYTRGMTVREIQSFLLELTPTNYEPCRVPSGATHNMAGMS